MRGPSVCNGQESYGLWTNLRNAKIQLTGDEGRALDARMVEPHAKIMPIAGAGAGNAAFRLLGQQQAFDGV